MVFGTSRLAYLLAVFNIFTLPLFFIFPKLLPVWTDRPEQDWLAVFALAVQPMLWVPIVLGYVDVGGLVAAFLILFYWWRGPKRDLRRDCFWLGLGLGLAFMPFFRRWYLFWVVSFAAVAGFDALWDWIRRRSRARLIEWFCLCAVAAAVYLVIAGPLLMSVAGSGYLSKLSAYRFFPTPADGFYKWLLAIGLAPAVLLAAGFIYACRRSDESRRRAVFLLAQSTILFIHFSRTQDFGVQHLYLLLPAVAFFHAHALLIPNRLWRVTAAIVSVFAMACVFFPSFADTASRAEPWSPEIRYYPDVRRDLTELVRLREELLRLPQIKDPKRIYVAASSVDLNSHTLEFLERSLGLPRRLEPMILWTRNVDRVETLPDYLFWADYVVVADPIQYHLRPKDQRCVGIVARHLLDGTGFGKAYARLPFEARLQNGAVLSIYQKVRPVAPGEKRELIDEYLDYYPEAAMIQMWPES
jgi:hypothetical protein